MRKRLTLATVYVITASALMASTIGVTVNGSCIAGSCPPTTQAIGTNFTQNFDYTVTLANSDSYRIFGEFDGENTSGILAGGTNHDFEVMYLGNSSGTGAASSDSITVEGMYAFATTLSSESIYRNIVGSFGGGIGVGSTGSTCLAGGTLGCVNVSAPGAFSAASSTFSFGSTSGVFNYQPYFTSNFAAGSPVGSFVVWGQTAALTPPNASPEPGELGLAMLGCGAVGVGCIRRGLLEKLRRKR